ncbi:hypothetical protein [Xylocopilactobacillus apicola]|uniref:SMI1/KNR4 family protein n=1 Tax=Xylocopilactobacillus apicola TaxID=2932184 RepID=A0AAU9DL85_9LACO|nr:hypothetical protein [Xylocopilactobacillus apicola]BDR57642.1 hypothetical protein XA3_00830 [Xylocopilactobacillus apicola]
MSVKESLDNYKNSFDRRSKAFIEECISYGMTEKEAKIYAKQKILSGSVIDKIPTLDIAVYQKVSPQLNERFLYADSWEDIGETFLNVEEMIELVGKPHFKSWVTSMRDNWEDSAPAIYPDEQLSVISVMSEDEGDYTLAVWDKPLEPEIWRYSGQSEQKFKDLLAWLDWLNGD